MFKQHRLARVAIVVLMAATPAFADSFNGQSPSAMVVFSHQIPAAPTPAGIDAVSLRQPSIRLGAATWTGPQNASTGVSVDAAAATTASTAADLDLFSVIPARERWLAVLIGLGLAALQLRRKQRSHYHSLYRRL